MATNHRRYGAHAAQVSASLVIVSDMRRPPAALLVAAAVVMANAEQAPPRINLYIKREEMQRTLGAAALPVTTR